MLALIRRWLPAGKPQDASGSTLGLTRLVDAAALLALAGTTLWALASPGDPLPPAGMATAVCAWVAIRVAVESGCGGRWWPAPGLMFVVLMLITNHLGGFYYYREPMFSPPSAAMTSIWAVNLAYLAFAAGMWTYTRASRLDVGRLIDEFYARPVVFPPEQQALFLPALLTLCIGSGVSLILMGFKLPILDAFRSIAHGDFFGVRFLARAARESLYTDDEHPYQGALEQFRSAVVPMVVLLWYATWRISRQQFYRWLWLAGTGVAAVLLTGNLQRSALILFIVQVVVLAMLINPPKPSVKWLYGLTAGFALLVLLSLLLGRGAVHAGIGTNIQRQISASAFRLYGSNSRSSVKVFELFPRTLAFRNGQTWLTGLRGLLPGKGATLNLEIFHYFGKGTGGAGVNFIAEMWANGGWLSIIIASFITGVFLQWVNIRWLSLPRRTPLSLTVMAATFFCLALMGWGGQLTPVNRGLPVFIILGWIYERLLRQRQAYRRPATPAPAPAGELSAAG